MKKKISKQKKISYVDVDVWKKKNFHNNKKFSQQEKKNFQHLVDLGEVEVEVEVEVDVDVEVEVEVNVEVDVEVVDEVEVEVKVEVDVEVVDDVEVGGALLKMCTLFSVKQKLFLSSQMR